MPSDRAPVVAAAIATARIFVVKAPGPAIGQTASEPVPPGQLPQPQPATSQPDPPGPDPSLPEPSSPSGSQPAQGRTGAMRQVVTR